MESAVVETQVKQQEEVKQLAQKVKSEDLQYYGVFIHSVSRKAKYSKKSKKTVQKTSSEVSNSSDSEEEKAELLKIFKAKKTCNAIMKKKASDQDKMSFREAKMQTVYNIHVLYTTPSQHKVCIKRLYITMPEEDSQDLLQIRQGFFDRIDPLSENFDKELFYKCHGLFNSRLWQVLFVKHGVVIDKASITLLHDALKQRLNKDEQEE